MKTCFAIGMLFDGRMSAIFSMMFVASVFILVARLSRKGIAADASGYSLPPHALDDGQWTDEING